MGTAVAHEISPELVLVCPELRARALTLLPTLDPDELFTIAPPSPARIVEPPRLVLVEREPEPERLPVEPERPAPLPVALAAYATEALLLGALRCLGFTTVIAVAAFALSW